MTLSELISVTAIISGGSVFAMYMGSSHHWLVGVIALPFGILAMASVLCLFFEAYGRVRRSYIPLTPGSVFGRGFIAGTVLGACLAVVFYSLTLFGLVPTQSGFKNTQIVSAALFGTSVALTTILLFMEFPQRSK